MPALVLGANIDYHNDGRAAIGSITASGNFEQPFLNLLKNTGSAVWAASIPAQATEDINLLFDSNGYPTRMYTATLSNNFWLLDASAFIGCAGGTQGVITFPTGATVTPPTGALSNGQTLTINSTVSGRIDFTIGGASTTGAAAQLPIRITGMTPGAFTGGEIKIFLLKYEARVNAGEIFDPDFLNRYRPVGVVRAADWWGGGIQTDGNSAALASDARSMTKMNWIGGFIDSTRWAGTGTFTTENKLSVAMPSASFASWTEGQMIQFKLPSKPLFMTATNATAGATTVFECVGHRLSTGNIVEFTPNSTANTWGSLLTYMFPAVLAGPKSFTVLSTPDANHFELDYDSTGAPAWGAITRDFYIQLGLTCGALASVPCTSTFGMLNFFQNQNWAASYPAFAWGVYNAQFGRFQMIDTNSNPYINPGPPFEVLSRLANALAAHPWIQSGNFIGDGWRIAMATHMRDNLLPGLMARFEEANEVWNNGYKSRRYANLYGQVEAAFLTGPLTRAGSYMEYAGYRAWLNQGIFDTIFASTGKRMQAVISCQGVSPTSSVFRVDAMRCPAFSGYIAGSTDGDIVKYPTTRAKPCIAPYLYPPFYNAANAQNYSDYVARMLDFKAGTLTPSRDFWKGVLRDNSDDGTTGPFATQFPFVWWRDVGMVEWGVTVAALAASGVTVTMYCYEGWHHIQSIDIIALNWTNPSAVTKLDVKQSVDDFLQVSSQAADLMTEYLTMLVSFSFMEFPATLYLYARLVTTGSAAVQTAAAAWVTSALTYDFYVNPLVTSPTGLAYFDFNNP